MPPQCVSGRCDYPMDARWDFCPACGTDNRPPARRGRVASHYHRFVAKSGYCWMCGEPANEPYVFGRKWRLGLSAFAVFGGLAALLGAILIRVLHRSPVGSLGRWVKSWYDIATVRRGKGGHLYTELRGDEFTLLAFLFAPPLIVFGLLLFFRVPMKGRYGPSELWE